jgi:hypothetical protein
VLAADFYARVVDGAESTTVVQKTASWALLRLLNMFCRNRSRRRMIPLRPSAVDDGPCRHMPLQLRTDDQVARVLA